MYFRPRWRLTPTPPPPSYEERLEGVTPRVGVASPYFAERVGGAARSASEHGVFPVARGRDRDESGMFGPGWESLNGRNGRPRDQGGSLFMGVLPKAIATFGCWGEGTGLGFRGPMLRLPRSRLRWGGSKAR